MDNIKLLLETAYKAIDDKKGKNITVLNIGKLTTIADYFIIATGTSTTHVKAMADEVEEKIRELDFCLGHREGYNSGRWILLDYKDVVIHIFHEEDRSFYNIERLWGDAPRIDVDNS